MHLDRFYNLTTRWWKVWAVAMGNFFASGLTLNRCPVACVLVLPFMSVGNSLSILPMYLYIDIYLPFVEYSSVIPRYSNTFQQFGLIHLKQNKSITAHYTWLASFDLLLGNMILQLILIMKCHFVVAVLIGTMDDHSACWRDPRWKACLWNKRVKLFRIIHKGMVASCDIMFLTFVFTFQLGWRAVRQVRFSVCEWPLGNAHNFHLRKKLRKWSQVTVICSSVCCRGTCDLSFLWFRNKVQYVWCFKFKRRN